VIIDFHPEAADEADDSFEWYRAVSESLALNFLNALDEVQDRVLEAPQAYRPAARSAQKCPMKGFPFKLVYRHEGDFIWVVALAHEARKENYWVRRLDDEPPSSPKAQEA